jgi:hypothetical protein
VESNHADEVVTLAGAGPEPKPEAGPESKPASVPTVSAGKAGSTTGSNPNKNPAPQQTSKTAAARSGGRKVTTAPITPTKSTASADALAGTAILNVPASPPQAPRTREPFGPGEAAQARKAAKAGQARNAQARTAIPPTQPTRPPWRPTQIPPPDKPESRGLTVLGTTLTRRQTVIAAAVILAVLLLLVLFVPRAFGDDPGEKTAGKIAPPVATPTKAATSAPAVAPPPTSTKPSSAPTTTPPASDVPKGWYRYTDRTGFSVPLPNGWKASKQGSEVYFQGKGRLLIIDQTKSPKPDPVADWKGQEADRRGKVYRNYKKIRIDSVDYFKKAADWEFLYTTRAGNAQHAQKRGFIVGPKQAYGISWYTSPGDWDRAKADLEIIYKGFKPAKG